MSDGILQLSATLGHLLLQSPHLVAHGCYLSHVSSPTPPSHPLLPWEAEAMIQVNLSDFPRAVGRQQVLGLVHSWT